MAGLSLRAKTTAMVVGIGLLVAALDAVNLWHEHSGVIDRSRESTANVAQSVAQHTEVTFRAIDSALVGVVERLETEGRTAAALERLRKVLSAQISTLPQLDGITVADADGNLIVTSRSTNPAANIADRGYFSGHKADLERGTHIGSPVVSRITGRQVIPMSRRLNNPDGTFAGVILATVGIEYFQRFYETFKIGQQGTIALLSDDGTLLARRPFDERLVGRQLDANPPRGEVRPQSTSHDGIGTSPIDGRLRLFVRQRVEAFPLSVSSSMTIDEVLAGWRSELLNHLIGGGILMVIIGVLGWHLVAEGGRRRRAEQAAEAQAADYRLLADSATDMIFRLDLSFERRYVSPACRDILGYAPEELIGTRPADQLHPDDADRVGEIYASLVNGRDRASTTNRIRHRDGRWIWVDANFRLIRDPKSGEAKEIYGSLRDVTQRRKAEDAAVAAERRLTDAIESISDGFILFDRDDRLITVNQRYLAMMPWARDAIVPGVTFEQISRRNVEHGQRDALDQSIEERIQGALAWHRAASGNIEVKMDDGRWLLASERPTSDGGIVGIRTDITRLKQVEEELTAKIADLEDTSARLAAQGASLVEMAEGLAAARDAAEAASRSKADFLATMSHEIRTPMHGIIGTADLMLRGALDDGQRERARMLRECAGSLLSIINDILDISKLEAGHFALDNVGFTPALVVGQVVDLLRSKADEKGLQLVARIDESACSECRGDPTRIRQVLLNFIGNAIKFTERGSVTVAARRTDEALGATWLEIEVADTGIGISAEAQRGLFQKFSQADTSIARRFGGTGLGLAIAKGLIEAMGGTLGLESRAGEGSRFWFRLPLRDTGAGSADTEPAEPQAAVAASGGGRRILLAEDIRINQIIATEMLVPQDYAVDVAQNGAEAVEAARTTRYDLILMDVHMPLVDGIEATRRIRAMSGAASQVPIIALTADAVAGVREQYLAAGLDDFLSKPFSAADLFAVIERWTSDLASGDTAELPRMATDESPIAEQQFASLREVMSNAKFSAFLTEWLGATRERVERISALAGGSDLPALRREAHDLVSTAGGIGASRLTALARYLEQVCVAGNADDARACAAEIRAAAIPACLEVEHRLMAA
jgi:PAS domain S-box-containing protein